MNDAAPYAADLYRAAQEAFVSAWQHAMWAGVVVMALLLVFVLLQGPRHGDRLPS
jgi:hypothetical protein